MTVLSLVLAVAFIAVPVLVAIASLGFVAAREGTRE